MFRLIGFLIGSLSSVIIILLIIGMPRFNVADQKADQQRYDEAIEKLKAKQHEFESVAEKLSDNVAQVAESMEQGFDSPAPTSTQGPPPDQQAAVDNLAATGAAAVAIDDTFASEIEDGNMPQETLWYSFWNPFRSELAANGFVTQLERVTGLDYRVVKVKSGVYEVAFAYGDDTERNTKLAQISAATGLELTGS
ncbi:MAG: hypothetical protein ACR2Q3_10615 [Woeseiaceae bacterium]